MSKLSVIIPVYNEAASVQILLENVYAQEIPCAEKELIIVESGSIDGTREIVQKWVSDKKEQQNPNVSPSSIRLILQEKPRGKGNAVREALDFVTGDILLIQDGDLEYDVKDYPLLLEPILTGKAKFVLGSRHLSAGSWKIRKFEKSPMRSTFLNLGGVLFHGLFNLLYWQRLTDPTTMYKVFHIDCIKNLQFSANRFDFDFELVAKIIRNGFNPIEVPISYTSRGFEEGKKINVLRDPFTWAWAILKYRFVEL